MAEDDKVAQGKPPVAHAALRVHRHELLNSLQLVQAYIQLERPQRALAAVSDLAQWLQTLSVAQSTLEATAPDLMWTAIECSRVHIGSVKEGVVWTESGIAVLRSFWRFADQQVAAVGTRAARLEIVDQDGTEHAPVQVRLCIAVRTDADQALCGQLQAYIDQHARTDNAQEVEFVLAAVP